MRKKLLVVPIVGVVLLAAGAAGANAAADAPGIEHALQKLDSPRGICAILGDPRAETAIALAKASDLVVYVQLPGAKDVDSARRAAETAGILNTRVYVEKGSDARLHLADSLADAVVVCGAAPARSGSFSACFTARTSASPSKVSRRAASIRDFSRVNSKIDLDFSSATCPWGVHHSVSSFSIVSFGSLFASETPVTRLNQRYIASRFSCE